MHAGEHLQLVKESFGSTGKKIVNTATLLMDLNGFSTNRASGNTIRQVDLAIQSLFDGDVVVCFDHYQYGDHRMSNERLLDMIIKRLVMEHKRVQFKADRKLLTIYLPSIWQS